MENCPICFEELNDQTISTLNCNHYFCDECLNKLFETNKNQCPMCRSEIKEYHNKEEKTRVIFRTVYRESDARLFREIMVRYNQARVKNYFLMASILGLFYLLMNVSYQQGIYEKMIEDYKKNNTELITDYNNCIRLIDTNNNDLYDTIRGIFSLCNVPISYLKKCYI